MPPGLIRWMVCGAMVVTTYLLLALGLLDKTKVGKRTYRFAD